MGSPFKSDVLKGKVALLTGGASGIGLEISTQFGKHGASVALMGRRKNVLDSAVNVLRSLGIRVFFHLFQKPQFFFRFLKSCFGIRIEISMVFSIMGP